MMGPKPAVSVMHVGRIGMSKIDLTQAGLALSESWVRWDSLKIDLYLQEIHFIKGSTVVGKISVGTPLTSRDSLILTGIEGFVDVKLNSNYD